MNSIKNNKPQNLLLIITILYSISAVISKAGMNIFGALLAVSCFLIAMIEWKKMHSTMKIIFFIGISSYLFFFMTSTVVAPTTQDINSFWQKNIFLLIIPTLSYVLSNRSNRRSVSLSFVFTCLISALFSIYKFSIIGEFDLNYRAIGFTGYTTHLNALLLGLCIAFGYLSKNNSTKLNVFLALTFIASVVSIIISGTRGVWVAMILIMLFFLFRYNRKLLPSFLLILVASSALLHYTFPGQSNALQYRITNIVNTDETSNSERLSMWKGGLDYLTHTASSDPKIFLFGNGMNSSDKNYKSYIYSLPEAQQKTYMVNGSLHGGSDFHNAYIDLSVKSGFIYMLVIVFVIFGSFLYSANKNETNDRTYQISACYLVGFFVMSPFYSMFQDYSIYATVLGLAFILGKTMEERDAAKHTEQRSTT